MKSLLLICPYFGKLPIVQMRLWLNSCANNPTIDWIIFTDDRTKELNYPSNVRVVYTTLAEIKLMAQKVMPFSISLERPYKLCDYKPAYGLIFAEYVKGYDFWGHCDMTDSIFGNLRNFLTDDFFEGADKFFYLGHLTIYRNTLEVNTRVLLDTKACKNNAQKIFGDESNHAFDELNSTSINTIYQENGWEIRRLDDMYRDNDAVYKSFVRIYRDNKWIQHKDWRKRIYEWNNGHLYECIALNDKVLRNEIGYVHFQKRVITSNLKDFSHFLLIPNCVIDSKEEITSKFIRRVSQNYIFYKPYFKLRYKNLKYKIKRMLLG